MKNNLLFQENIRESFHRVENDMERMITEQKILLKRIEELESSQRRMLFSFANAAVTNFIGSRETREIHREDCLLIASIKNFDKIAFTNKLEAKQQGFRECLCLF